MNHRFRLPRITHAFATLACLVFAANSASSQSQMFPSKPEAKGLSAFLIAPTEGMDGPPADWTLTTGRSYGNAALADECLVPAKAGALCTTKSDELPESVYHVSILVRGQGMVRLAGSEEWIPFETKSANSFQWIDVGVTEETTRVSIELGASKPKGFYYGGALAEGDVVPVNPVSAVREKLRGDQPVTIVLVGDSVTENSRGKGGGASAFEKGNPGLILSWLAQTAGEEVDYLAHREPKTWPAGKDASKIPTVEIDGQECFDSRIETDASKRVHLINMGKGGAAADWGWTRVPDTIVEQDYIEKDKPAKERRPSVRYGLSHYEPDLIIVNFGTNDVNGAHPDVTVEDYMFRMRVLATNLQRRFGAAVILSTPHKWTGGVHLKNHLQPRMVDALRDFSDQSGIALADVYNEYEAGEYDGIHPGDRGHGHIADAYTKAMLGEPSNPSIQAEITSEDLKENPDGTVTDTKHGLTWTKNADLGSGEVSPEKALEVVSDLNSRKAFGHDDWRLPTRDELLGLVDPAQRQPALPEGHPFIQVVGWYLTSDGRWGVDMDSGAPYSPLGRAGELAGRVWAVR